MPQRQRRGENIEHPHHVELLEFAVDQDRRYREDPEKFWSEATRLLKNTPESYGEACAPYFLKLLREKERAVEESAALSVFPPPEPAR